MAPSNCVSEQGDYSPDETQPSMCSVSFAKWSLVSQVREELADITNAAMGNRMKQCRSSVNKC